MYDLFADLAEGERLRDEGMDQAADNSPDWLDRAIALFPRLVLPPEFIGEDINIAVVRLIGEPHSDKVFGSIPRILKSRGMIVDVEGWGKMKRPRSHARRSPVYRRA